MAIKDITGKTFHRLTVIAFAYTKNRSAFWLCVCSCPAKTQMIARGAALRFGDVKSCGCQKIDSATKHGHNKRAAHGAPSPTYGSWMAMMGRCTNPNNKQYWRYGAMGITVHEPWYDFRNFLTDMSERPRGQSLDRFPNPHGNYEPSNCRWATIRQQANNRRNTPMLTFNNETKALNFWAEDLRIPPRVFKGRLRLGWDDAKILTTPYIPRKTP